jgi:heme exporter protein CcmB
MMLAKPSSSARCLYWLIHKDLTREFRAQDVWPKTILFAVVMVLLLAMQLDGPREQQVGEVAGLLWIAILFAGTLTFERSFTSEHDAGCWQDLRLYPVAPSAVFLAKMAVNYISLVIMELIIVALFIVLADVPLLARPGVMMLVIVLGSIGLSAVGTLIAALTAGLRNRGGLLALLYLPIVSPLVLSSAEATRIILANHSDPLWWWWNQLLAAFALVFTVVGAIVFEFVMEE